MAGSSTPALLRLLWTSDKSARYRVLPLTLETGQVLPVLVESATWIPARVATRWAVRRRRMECMDSTLAGDLRGLALLYQWSASKGIGLDDLLERGELPNGPQLESLTSFLRVREAANGELTTRSLSTVGNHAVAIRTFLIWACDPENQGRVRCKSISTIAEERQRLRTIFEDIARYAGKSQRISPLNTDELQKIHALVYPIRDEDGRILVPLTFHELNPFRPENRLRNCLMVATAEQNGPRRGELLKLRLDDVSRGSEHGLMVRRRPHDPNDVRRYKPRVKTSERLMDTSEEIGVYLREYLTSRPPVGRVSGKTPYLFVTADGQPLSISAADAIPEVIGKHAELPDLSWHSFRHSWAESIAEDLINDQHEQKESAVEILRDLGGWKRNSDEPLHYIENAMRKAANNYLRNRNDRLYSK